MTEKEPCVHANTARLEMVEQLHTALYGSTWARPETPKQVWEQLLGEVRRLRTGMPNTHLTGQEVDGTS